MPSSDANRDSAGSVGDRTVSTRDKITCAVCIVIALGIAFGTILLFVATWVLRGQAARDEVSRPNTIDSPEYALNVLLMQAMRKRITATDVQGTGDTRQGYAVWIRFKTEPGLASLLKKNGFRNSTWSKMRDMLQLPEDYRKEFSPPWRPALLQDSTILASCISNSWTHSGANCCLATDEASGIGYFYSSGP